MNKTVLLGTLTTLLGWATSSAAGNADTTHHVSQPVYAIEFQMAQDFLGKTGALEQAFKAFCEENSEGNQTLKQAWHMTMLSWMALQGQERGPAAALEQSWNVQFWPDKKNTTGRKMHALIASEKAWNADEISAQSVTVQGLGAVEWLLYDKASTLQNNAGTCATGIAIAENLHNTAQKISDAWKLNPWTSLSQDAWESEYISLLSNQLDYSLKKLKRPLADIGKPKPYFAESWRSETSLSNLKANLQGMQTLYLANGEGLDAQLRARGETTLADRVKGQFEAVLETWPQDKSLFAALQSKEGYKMVLAQYNKLEQLKFLISKRLRWSLGLSWGSMRLMVTDQTRRALLKAALAGVTAPLLPFGRAFGGQSKPALLGCAIKGRDHFLAVVADDSGLPMFTQPLPARGHGTASNQHGHAVVFGRRPGTFFLAFDYRDGRLIKLAQASDDRHFYGHGVYSHDGSLLFATEGEKGTSRGIIGVYHVESGYRKVDELTGFGIGPHEVIMMPDGVLAVGVGGVHTNGRKPLNLNTMKPSLCYLSQQGKVLDTLILPDKKLSIRHLAHDGADTVLCGQQYRGEPDEYPALIAMHKRGEEMQLLKAEPEEWARFNHYIASIAATEDWILATSPPGNCYGIWSKQSGDLVELNAWQMRQAQSLSGRRSG